MFYPRHNQRRVSFKGAAQNCFVVLAGRLEGESKNYKHSSSMESFAEVIKAVKLCDGYDFIDIEYIDDQGYAWEVKFDPIFNSNV